MANRLKDIFRNVEPFVSAFSERLYPGFEDPRMRVGPLVSLLHPPGTDAARVLPFWEPVEMQVLVPASMVPRLLHSIN